MEQIKKIIIDWEKANILGEEENYSSDQLDNLAKRTHQIPHVQ